MSLDEQYTTVDVILWQDCQLLTRDLVWRNDTLLDLLGQKSHICDLLQYVSLPTPQEQYTLCFELLQAYLDSFDTYANFKAL